MTINDLELIKVFSQFLERNLKYIIISLVIILFVLILDSLIKESTVGISGFDDFLINGSIMIGVTVFFSFLTGYIVERFHVDTSFNLNRWGKRNIWWIVVLVYLFICIILNVKYGRFTPDTETILRNYTFINKTLNFLSL